MDQFYQNEFVHVDYVRDKSDLIFMRGDVLCDMTWLETYCITLNYRELMMYKLQQAQFSMANIMSELYFDKRLS